MPRPVGFDERAAMKQNLPTPGLQIWNNVVMPQNNGRNYLCWKFSTPYNSLPRHNKHLEPQCEVLFYHVNSSEP